MAWSFGAARITFIALLFAAGGLTAAAAPRTAADVPSATAVGQRTSAETTTTWTKAWQERWLELARDGRLYLAARGPQTVMLLGKRVRLAETVRIDQYLKAVGKAVGGAVSATAGIIVCEFTPCCRTSDPQRQKSG